MLMNDDLFWQFECFGIWLLGTIGALYYYRYRAHDPGGRYSTFGPRFWASGIIDPCILGPVAFIASASLLLNIPRAAAALLVIVQSLAWLLYRIVMHGRYGQTIGKMVVKVRVVDFHTEGKISFRQAWLRESIPVILSLIALGFKLSDIPSGDLTRGATVNGELALPNKPLWLLLAIQLLWFLAEVLSVLLSKKRRALHDFIAGTVVVRIDAQERSVELDGPDVVSENSSITNTTACIS
jgi:uncharacterized RDD family membrane protein YckC